SISTQPDEPESIGAHPGTVTMTSGDEEQGLYMASTPPLPQWLARYANKPYAYLTTTGRRTGQPHRIEIWFGVDEGRMYLLAGGRERSDWVRNLLANAHV